MNKIVESFIEAGQHPHPGVRKSEEDDEIRASLLKSRQIRAEKLKDSEVKKKDRYINLGVASLAAVTLLAGASVYSMAGERPTERAQATGDIPELSAKKVDIMGVTYCHLTIQGPNDTWNYIETYHAEQDVPLDKVLEMVVDANPGVDFETLHEGDRVYVPELTNPLRASHIGLETDQPIGDVHVN